MTIDYRKEVEEYRAEMTEAERMEKYMKGEEVDHLPFGLLSSDECFANLLGYTTTDMREDFEVMCKVIDFRIKEYGLHGIGVGLNLRTLGYVAGSKPYYPENGVDHVDEFRFPRGVDLDVDSLKTPDPYNDEVMTPMLDLAKKLKERFPDETISTGVCAPISSATGIRPVEALLKDTRKNREEYDKLLDYCLKASLKWAEAFNKEFGSTQTSIADPVACTDILSPKQFDDLALPYLRDLADGLYEINDIKPSLHICGHTKMIWDRLRELNISSFSVDNWEDIGECSEAFGEKMPIVGNVPPTDILAIGTPEEVVESVKTCIKKAGASPNGYILNTGCAVVFSTPRENIDAFVYAVRKYGANVVKGKVPEAVYQD